MEQRHNGHDTTLGRDMENTIPHNERRKSLWFISILCLCLLAATLATNGRRDSFFRLLRPSRHEESIPDTANHTVARPRSLEEAYQDNEEEGDEEENPENESDDGDDGRVINDDFYAFPEDPVLTLMPLSERDYIGFALAFASALLASAGGVGGGGMILPIYLLVLEMTPSVASPLTAVSVFGAAVASTLLNSCKRHPLADRPLIDWDIVLVMEPVMLVGTIAGTMIRQVLSEQVLVVVLVVLLGVVAHQTIRKARRMYIAEKQFMEQLKETTDYSNEPPDPISYYAEAYFCDPLQAWEGLSPEEKKNSSPNASLENGNSPSRSGSGSPNTSLDSDSPNITLVLESPLRTRSNSTGSRSTLSTSLKSEMTEQEKFTSRKKIIAICCMFSVAIFLNTMLGGGAFESPWGISCGGMVFWLVHVISFSFLFAFAWGAHTYVVHKHEIKQLTNYDFVHGDVRWDTKGALLYPLLFLCTGLFAGTLGIGGGILNLPILLVMSVHPEVATATSSCMILFTSAASMTSYAVFGLIHWDYAAVCAVVGFVASLLGKILMRRVKKDKINGINVKRESFIAFAVGGVLLLSGILLSVHYIFIIEGVSEDDSGGICYDSRL